MKRAVLIYVLLALLPVLVILPGNTTAMEAGNEQIQQVGQQYLIYPNPVKDFLYLELQELDPTFLNETDLKLEIRNILGNVMLLDMEKVTPGKYRINASSYPNGYYMLTIYCKSCTGKEKLQNAFKFLKQ